MDPRNVGICLDTGHANLAGDLQTVVHKLSGHLMMIHLSDNRGTGDDHLPPGRGLIEWGTFFANLTEVGFHGAMIMEISGDLRENRDDLLGEARQARKFVHRTSKAVAMRA